MLHPHRNQVLLYSSSTSSSGSNGSSPSGSRRRSRLSISPLRPRSAGVSFLFSMDFFSLLHSFGYILRAAGPIYTVETRQGGRTFEKVFCGPGMDRAGSEPDHAHFRCGRKNRSAGGNPKGKAKMLTLSCFWKVAFTRLITRKKSMEV